MSRPEELDDLQENDKETDKVSDPYTAETGLDIYDTPDTGGEQPQWDSSGKTAPVTEPETPEETAPVTEPETPEETVPVTEPEIPEETAKVTGQEEMAGNGQYGNNISHENQQPQGSNLYSSSPYNPCGNQQARGSSPYGSNFYASQQTQGGNLYGSNPYGGEPLQGGNPYGSNPYGGEPSQGGSPYGSNPYGGGQTQGGSPYGSNPYGGGQAQDGNPYGSNPYGGGQAQGGSPYGSNPYGGGQAQGGSPYGSNPYGSQPGYGGGMYNNNPYSPYAAPSSGNNTKLIIGIVAVIILLFLIAVFALTYKVISLYSEEREKSRYTYEEHEFSDDREQNREKHQEENDLGQYGYGYGQYDDYYDDYYYDDYYYDDYDYDSDPYYTLHDDIKENLSYSVDFDYYEYDADDKDVEIAVTYPVITGDDVPNLEHLNDVIAEEIDLFTDYYEEEYAEYMDSGDSYFSAYSSGYVTYMDEEKLSIVFSEYIYTDYYNEVFLYSINIDMENGVILDNENMLSIDDSFSVDFRKRSDVQNGEITYLTGMTDQEITDYFNSSGIIVFYTPKGMEIGFNYEEGWVTVTYEEYEQYLKVF